MNKIYKVIWSKVRNCYVAVSEIAKRNGKSCTSVNCGAKANRGHAGMALAIALSLSLAGGGAAWAEEITVNNPPAISADKSSTDYILSYGTVSTAAGAGTTFTVTGTGKVKSIKSEKSGNVITIQANGAVTGGTGDSGLVFSIKGGVNNNSVTVAGSTEYYVAGGASDSSSVTKNTVTVSGTTRDVYGGITGSGFSDSSGSSTYNTVNINTGGSVGNVYGGSTQGSVGNAEHNTVTIKGTASYAYGGQSYQGSATYNSVIVDNGIVTSGIYGGQVTNFADTGTTAVSNNTVTIKGSQSKIASPGSNISYSVYGGHDDRRTGYSTVNNNGVEISGGEFNKNTNIYGAWSWNGSPSNNYVTITGGQVPCSVYGGYSDTGAALYNKVSISGANTVVGGDVRGGRSGAGGNASYNNVTISGGTISNNSSSKIYGGFAYLDGSSAGDATDNKVTVSGTSTIGSSSYSNRDIIFGGSAYGNATKNEVIINLDSGSTIYGSVYGGYAQGSTGIAGGDTLQKGNRVTISGGTVTGTVAGGYSYNGAGARYNQVTVNGTGNTGTVYGGRNYYGSGDILDNRVTVNTSGTVSAIIGGNSSTSAVSVQRNMVTIEKGTISGRITGGTSTAGSTVSSNRVIISGGTINGTNSLEGGHSTSGNVTNNTVVITGGNFIGKTQSIFAGSTQSSGEISGNTITIAGGSFNSSASDSNHKIYGGYVTNNITTIPITDNTINLYGSVTGLNKANLYGAKYSNTNTTGNELHIGGIKSGLTLPVTVPDASPWTGTSGNKVASVNNFNKIVLHKVDWSTTTPVLAAVSFNNNFASDGYLDIMGSNLLTADNLGYGRKALLASDTDNNFRSMRVKYKSGITNTLYFSGNNIYLSEVVRAGTVLGNTNNSKGVTLTYNAKEHVVTLDPANSYRNVLYYICDNVKSVSFGEMTWGTGRDLSQETNNQYYFCGDNNARPTIDASNLSFAGTVTDTGSTPSIQANTEMTLLANATGITTGNSITQPGTGKGKVLFNYNNAFLGVPIDATATGTVYVSGSDVKYKVNAVTVDKVTLGSSGALTWGSSSSFGWDDYGWNPTSSTVIDATGVTYNERGSSISSALKVNDKTSIFTAPGLSSVTANNILMPSTTNNKVTVPLRAYVDTSTSNPITLNATAYGDIIIENNTVKTKITSISLDNVTLGTYSWGATQNMPETWTASGSTTIDDTNFAYTGTANTKLKQNDTAVILNATGLTTNSKVIRDTGASATKTVGMNFTDSSGDGASSIRFTGTAKGHVEAAADKVNYVVDGATLDGIDLESWNGTPFNLDSTTWGWELAKDTPGAVTATVATAGMTVPSGLSAGEKKVIIEATGTDYFDGINIGEGNKWSAGTTLTDTAVLTSGGVTIAGKQTKAGVKVNEANKNQIVYEASKKNITGITLDTVTYAKNGTARSFDNTYDLSGATINANNLKFTDASQKNMEPGDTMTIVDASSAIKNASGLALPSFTSKTYNTAYTDTISGKGITFTGTHTDTLSQSTDTAKSKLIYTIGDKKVNNATISGTINWSDGGTHYTNGSEANQNGTNVNYKFDGGSAVDISGVAFNATVDPLAGSTKSMTLLKGVTGVVATKVSGTPAFTVALDKTNTKLDAKASGLAGVSGNDVIYTVNGVAIDKINVKSVGDTADVVPENWTLASGATVETDGMTVTVPSGLNHGQKKTIITAGVTDYFDGIMINGSNAWSAGTELTGNLTVGGVTITGTQTKGGVKVNEANKSQIVYEESKKNATSITLGEVKYVKGGTARSFDSAYDVSNATITADGLTFTSDSKTLMETGDSMTIVDAASAIANSITGHNLSAFTGKEYTLDYTDTITVKGVTFKGTHTDTLSQSTDTAKSKLIYTVGDKKVNSATVTGMINWSDGGAYYTNGSDANQNGTSATYTFNENTAVDISGVAFSATTDPLGKSMTLLKGVTGVAESKISGTPSFAVALDKSNTKLDAKASGSAGVSGNDVTYAVSDVAIDKINVKSIANDADTVPDGWTLAKDDSDKVTASVETDGLSVSDPSGLEPGQTKVIIEAAAGSSEYFKDVAVNGDYAWKVNGSDITSDLDIGGVAITGTQTKGGVKVNEADTNQIIYEESKKMINTLTLGNVTFKNDDGTATTVARAFDNNYDVSMATISAGNLAFTNSDIMETGNTMRIVDASTAIPNAVSGKKLASFTEQSYDVDFTDTITGKGVIFAGKHTDTLSQDAEQTTLTYIIGDKVVSDAKVTSTIDWSDDGTHYTNGGDANQNGTNATYTFNDSSTVDISGVAFNATTDPLGKSMTLLKGVTGVAEEKISGTPSFTVTLDQANTKLDAKATGAAGVSGNDVTYAVSGVAIDKINVTSVANAADTVPDGWTLAKDDSDKVIASVETDGLSISDPSGLEPGETKVIIEAATGSAEYFKDVSVNGGYAWKADGSEITSDLDIGGVAITGTQTKGGVKVNETDTNQIIYEESKKLVNNLTLGKIEFKIDDGTTATVARTFDKTYDVSMASISADDLAFTNSDIMETGNTMRIVDASAAIPNASSGKKMLSFTEQTKDVEFNDTITGKGITFKGTHTDTLSQDSGQTTLTYTVGDKVVSNASVSGDIGWQDGGTHYTNGSDANQNGTKATYTFNENSAVDISGVAFKADSDPLAGSTKSMTLLKGVAGVVEDKISGSPSFAVTIDQTNTKLEATATGAASVDEAGSLKYTVTAVELNTVTVNGTGNDALPEGWTVPEDVVIDTDSMTVPTDVAAGESKTILTAGVANLFSDEVITGANAYSTSEFTDTDAANIVTLTGTQGRGVTTADEGKSLVYKVGFKEVDNIDIGAVTWEKGATVMDGSTGYDYGNVTAIGTDNFDVTYDTPEKVAAGESMTLLKANETLKDMAAGSKSASYSFEPVAGVTVDAALTGNLAAKDGAVTYTVDANRASKLTFGGVEWKDAGALLARPANIVFAGADVDTSNISFTNVSYLDANRKMTLVSDFGDSVGNIIGKKYEVGKYTIGTAFEGEGTASLSGGDLVFTTTTDAGLTGQTHKTVMAMDAGLAMLLTGNEFVGKTMDGLAEVKNKGKDGVSTFASVGGGASRYTTGSHVSTHTWNAVVGVGKTNETKKGTMEYGVFGEYGKGSYMLHSDDGNGDGDAYYAGGGLLAKWTNKHDVYTEASIRAGRLSDSSGDIMQDGLGNKYGYDVHANYYGAHAGVGKIINYKGGKSLDVYGKFFYLKRDGVEYDAVQHYNLDSVSSSILRIGGRYGTTDKKWNWYGGLAYEYEFDGEAKGVVNGKAIRAASVKGSSVRGEFGMRMDATKTNPWQIDISLYGYAGRHRGFGGSVNVAYTF